MSNKLELARRFYNSSIGRRAWKIFKKIVNNRYIRFVLEKAIDIPSTNIVFDERKYAMPKIDMKNISLQKKALIVLPFYGNDATSKNIDIKTKALKELGYEIHVLVYNDAPWDENSPLWDNVYHVKVQNEFSYKLKYDSSHHVIDEGLNIDDWCGDELIQFISSLDRVMKYEFLLVNYVFLSKVADYVASEVKVLDTHDVFSFRNTKMRGAGVPEDKLFFSLTKEEEIKGLSRFKHVIAVQEKEGEYFKSICDSNVVVLPPMLPKQYLDITKTSKNPLIVGFLASGHYPNIVALNNFLEAFDKLNSDNVIIYIAGSICSQLENLNQKYIKILGMVESLEEFYSACSIIVNPDELQSGIKVKSLEAMSYGKPLVCTKAASLGMGTSVNYHNLEGAKECAVFIQDLSLTQYDLGDMSRDSVDVFNKFFDKYSVKNILGEMGS